MNVLAVNPGSETTANGVVKMGLRVKPSTGGGRPVDGLGNERKHATAPTVAAGSSMATTAATTTTTTTTTCISTTTYRSSSTSAIVAASNIRPQTLNVNNARKTQMDQTQLFFREVLNAWRAKARCNIVPSDRTRELFHELSFHPSDKQISEMLQTAKMLARKGNGQSHGLTFGEFCVLAADLKRFRTSTASSASICEKISSLGPSPGPSAKVPNNRSAVNGVGLRNSKSLSNVADCNKRSSHRCTADASAPVEVFLGGSCNPTTWRADVAIPALKELGISFYNPQVSDWTPDLIELEHRAKEKARVLFFVMDSETRASAGAIEAAHIAGQNCKQLVLVLHPYRPNQTILDEPISQQEYIDLMRNQMILREVVMRRGLPALDSIPLGLQRTKEILAGIREPPSNIATVLVVIRGAFDRVNPIDDVITLEQCQRALSYLGYAGTLINLDNLRKIAMIQREAVNSVQKRSGANHQQCSSSLQATARAGAMKSSAPDDCTIDYELFCVISAYLSVLQQEIQESGCISPIKGTNVPPPPVYLTNMREDEHLSINYYSRKNMSISRTSSVHRAQVHDERSHNGPTIDMLSRSNRDSGTSSPQPVESTSTPTSIPLPLPPSSAVAVAAPHANRTVVSTTTIVASKTAPMAIPGNVTTVDRVLSASPAAAAAAASDAGTAASGDNMEEESDSNDSVFSSSSSINSINCSSDSLSYASLDFRDVYLGGSCFLRTSWRQSVAMPYLKAKCVTFHLPGLHESLQAAKSPPPDDGRVVNKRREHTFIRTRRKCKEIDSPTKRIEEEEVVIEETFSWTLPNVRSTLFNPSLLDSSRVLLFVITNETRSLAPMTLAAHCIGLMYNVILVVQMLPDDCIIGNEKLTPTAIKDYNRGRSYLIDLAKRQGVPVFSDLMPALEYTVEKVKTLNSRNRCD